MSIQDHYKALGVSQDAGLEEIRRAFRREALRWHPDRNPGDPAAAGRFKAAARAYEVLRDPEKRRVYDLSLDGTAAETVFPDFGDRPGRGRRRGRGRGCGRGRRRRCGRRSRQDSWPAGRSILSDDQLVEIELDPAETMTGCERRIELDSVFGQATLTVFLPPGLEDGNVLRLVGNTWEDFRGIGGDIYLRIKVV